MVTDNREIEWQEVMNIPDGRHIGKIIMVDFRTDPYDYTDITICISSSEAEIKYSVPTNLSTQTKLGRLMLDFGETYQLNGKIKPVEILMSKNVEFMTITKPNKDGVNYASIVDGSLKPITPIK